MGLNSINVLEKETMGQSSLHLMDGRVKLVIIYVLSFCFSKNPFFTFTPQHLLWCGKNISAGPFLLL